MRDALPRRRRLGDSFASPRKIEQMLEELLAVMSAQLAPYFDLARARRNNYELFVQLLQRASSFLRTGNAAQHKEGRYPRTLLAQIVEKMSAILARESQDRISFRTFADNNLRLLSCPDDIKRWLEDGKITLFEALQLKRLSADNLALGSAQARAVREEFITRYRRERWIAHRLRHEIDLRLGKRPTESIAAPLSEIIAAPTLIGEELPLLREDSFCREQLSLMIELLQEIDLGEINAREQDRLLAGIDEVIMLLQQMRRKQRVKLPAEAHTQNLGVS
jgi:hypothetical protein